MTRRVWPFKPLNPVNEALEWATDVFRAKSAEQRISLRERPRRVFQYQHFFRDGMANYAHTLIRNAQGEDGFWVPDWTQEQTLGAVSAGSGVSLLFDTSNVHYGDTALLWESEDLYETISITAISGGFSADVSNTYQSAVVTPVWRGDAPNGLSVGRGGANINSASIGFVLTDDYDISATTYSQYRGHDVLTDCPVIANNSFAEDVAFPLSEFGNSAGDIRYLRSRTDPDFTCQMRWHKFNRSDLYALRQWLHSRKGRQKAFWLSSWGKDLEPSSISGTTVTVFNDILARPSGYDIEIVSGGTSYYRQVTNVIAGTPVGDRSTVDLTIDSSVPVSSADRISYLRCVRFDTDRVELNHAANGGTVVAVPCREVPVP